MDPSEREVVCRKVAGLVWRALAYSNRRQRLKITRAMAGFGFGGLDAFVI